MSIRNIIAIIYFFLFPKTFARGYETYKNYLISKILKGRKVNFDKYFDERIVEIPWVMSELKKKRGKLLDAGSTLNFKYLLKKLLNNFKINIVTLYPEKKNFEYLGIQYIYSDFINLKYSKNTFDVITCISTLEHVGFDNSFYNYNKKTLLKETKTKNKQLKVLQKFLNILKPGGQIFLTLPFGKGGKYKNLRQFDKNSLNNILKNVKARRIEKIFYIYLNNNWKKCTEND